MQWVYGPPSADGSYLVVVGSSPIIGPRRVRHGVYGDWNVGISTRKKIVQRGFKIDTQAGILADAEIEQHLGPLPEEMPAPIEQGD